ncbi:bifunctional phosphoribosyl-AMP cyclohydrolase/phosphoribosyl-ATP diphosphatase HisIE [Paramaledivibacter caminithermalis]|jgi:phosphoribosyl-ATP pyrophosphohydrolase/phosphoribosyl-AMP cyclohydrolase|uniref:Histidine biosynthesis bifunctional protein HisIE n=1 Tax=Paramaledivibacter caminithermalis (strain DSM 15212 / CIP 107654 / DViRD3) TaxID=1121301 RepID=A0A1M6K9N2_PARC5|nr:bifunctional phosphoribosyl-AMP cyclohydrolase/phosphoribosyl-ATP diphosphatase HisIE [Paramaledivibacter caminithermalis]SHJ55665.1 phosphoribosyl-ATP pyrophosphatase /phosphoribosyl-AMP cyclohydrolase [Paramaledivibacter caminithermalis DSM 15212]
MIDINKLKYDKNGLIPAIIQDCITKDVLMLGYMNKESLKLTIETKRTWFFSRSRQKLWNKGETSGNFHDVKEIGYDCDKDALLIKVKPNGPTCHTGENSCFYRSIYEEESKDIETSKVLDLLYERIINRKKESIEGSYTKYLFEKGINKILKKVGEEASEVIIAAKNDAKEEVIYEVSDLIYHLLVLLVYKNISFDEIRGELYKRYKK